MPVAREVVQMTWIQHVEGSPSFILESKLKGVKQALKYWARNSYQETEENKKKVKRELEDVQQKIEEEGLSQQNKDHEGNLYAQLSQINRKEEIKWRLKSRQLWLQAGDKNTTYFHKQVTIIKLKNIVRIIMNSEGN